MSPRLPRRAGATAADLAVGLGLAAAILLTALMALPRSREQARLAACQRNLGQIGLALALYDGMERHLPAIGSLEVIDPDPSQEGVSAGPGPLRALLDTLNLDNFQGLKPGGPLPRAGGPVPGDIPVAGFICPSDTMATARAVRVPVNYRAATGGDALGRDGLFAPGRVLSIEKVEAADGASFTAAFSERKVGNGHDAEGYDGNFAAVPGPIPPEGCPEATGLHWHGDAGSSWDRAGYRSTLYNHSQPPNAARACAAADGRSASIGASGGHPQGVNLLMLDASVRLVTPTVSLKVWREFANLTDIETPR